MDITENRFLLTLDFKAKTIRSINFVQNNAGSSVLELSIVDGGQVTDPATGLLTGGNAVDITDQVVSIAFLKPDNTLVIQDITTGVSILGDPLLGKVQCILMSNTLAAAGVVKAEVSFSKDGNKLSTTQFNFTVSSSLDNGAGVLSSNQIPVIEAQIAAWQAEFDASEVVRDNTFVASEDSRVAEFEIIKAEYEAENVVWNSNEADRVDAEALRVTEFSNLLTDVATGAALHADLQTDITTGDALDVTLKSDIATGDALDVTLKSDIATGGTTHTTLQADILLAQQNAFATEVTDARNSAVKTKTFATVGARLEESEQDRVTDKAETTLHADQFMSLQLALNYANSGTNKVVELTPGKTYSIATALKPYQDVIIKGNGAVIAPTNCSAFLVAEVDTQVSRFKMFNFTVNMLDAAAYPAYDVHGMYEWFFGKILFQNCNKHINSYSKDSSYAASYNNFVECSFYNNAASTEDIISITATGTGWANVTRFTSCRFGNTSTGDFYCIKASNARGIVFTTCSMEGTKGISVINGAEVGCVSSWLEFTKLPAHNVDATSSFNIIYNTMEPTTTNWNQLSKEHAIPRVRILDNNNISKGGSWSHNNLMGNPNFLNNADGWSVTAGASISIPITTPDGVLTGSRVVEYVVPAATQRVTFTHTPGIDLRKLRSLANNRFLLSFKLFKPAGGLSRPSVEIYSKETFINFWNRNLTNLVDGWNDVVCLFSLEPSSLLAVTTKLGILFAFSDLIGAPETWKIAEPMLCPLPLYPHFTQQVETILGGIPTDGHWEIGDKVTNRIPTAGGYMGWVCITAGMFKAVTGGTTGTSATGTNALTVNALNNLQVGDYISIVGISGVRKIVNIVGLVCTLNSTANASVTDAVISNFSPVIKGYGLIQA